MITKMANKILFFKEKIKVQQAYKSLITEKRTFQN